MMARVVLVACTTLLFGAVSRAQTLEELESWAARGKELQEAGDYRQAQAYFEKALVHGPRIWGARSENVSAVLNNLALNFSYLHEFEKAEEHYKKCLEIADFVFGDDSPQYALRLNNLAIVYRKTYRFAEAEKLIRQALKIREKKFGKEHEATADSLLTLADLYDDWERFDEAQTLHLDALAIVERKLGKGHVAVADHVHDLAMHYQRRGYYDRVEPLYRRALAIHEAALGADHPQVANTLNSLGNHFKDRGEFRIAETLYERSLAIRESKLGKNHPEVADPLNNLGILYMEMNQRRRAAELFHRAMVIRESHYGKDHPLVAQSCMNLALVMRQTNDADAEKWFLTALRIHENRQGKDHVSFATTLNNLGNLYGDGARYDESEIAHRRALAIYESKFGPNHPDVAMSLLNLAANYREQHQNDKAIQYYQRSLAIRRGLNGSGYLDASHSRFGMAIVQSRLNQLDAAVKTMDELQRSGAAFSAQLLPLLGIREQIGFLRGLRSADLEVALTWAYRHPGRQDIIDKTAEWIINHKGVGQAAIARAAMLDRQSDDPAVARIVAELLDVRRELAKLALSSPATGAQKSRHDRLATLTARELKLVRRLHDAKLEADFDNRWIELSDLQRQVTSDAVFVQIVRFQPYNFEAKGRKVWQPARYAAWIIRPGAQVKFVDLGPADAIEEAVRSARLPLENARREITENGEAEATAEALTPLKALARLVLAPLLPHVGQAERWIISPDYALWLAPWAALPLSDGTFVIEKHAVRMVIGGRDMLGQARPRSTKSAAPVIIADPDYDLELPAKADAEAASPATRLKPVRPLPGTMLEAAAIAERLERIVEMAPAIITGKEATAGAALKAPNPRFFILATHGFFMPIEELPASEREGLIRTAEGLRVLPGLEDPLLRCGLLFAGCNTARTAPTSETGVLTGREVISADLRGTELVVLSACDTAVGDIRIGEGVAGLRQAFQLAGADAVVATLWSVPDLSSARLLARFFDGLAAKLPTDKALQAAQRAEIELRRKRVGAAHPYYWAAYTLTGRVK